MQRDKKAEQESPKDRSMRGEPQSAGMAADPIDQQIADFARKHPILIALAERYSEIGKQAAQFNEGSPERRRLEKRIRRLEGYMYPMYDKTPDKQERFVMNFATSLLLGQFGRNGQKLSAWEEIRELTDRVAKGIRTRPPGNPIRYRGLIREALENKLIDGQRTWETIWDEVFFDTDVSFDDFKRQINLLKKFLTSEGIKISVQASKTK